MKKNFSLLGGIVHNNRDYGEAVFLHGVLRRDHKGHFPVASDIPSGRLLLDNSISASRQLAGV